MTKNRQPRHHVYMHAAAGSADDAVNRALVNCLYCSGLGNMGGGGVRGRSFKGLYILESFIAAAAAV